MKLALLVPEFTPLTFHWYDGVSPPLVGVAVNVTGVEAQTGLVEAMIDTLTGRFGLTVIVIVLLVAGLPVGHWILEVSMQDTRSPDTGLYVYVDKFDPTIAPFTFH